MIGFQRIARTEFHKCYWPGDLPDAAGVISENPRLCAGEAKVNDSNEFGIAREVRALVLVNYVFCILVGLATEDAVACQNPR